MIVITEWTALSALLCSKTMCDAARRLDWVA